MIAENILTNSSRCKRGLKPMTGEFTPFSISFWIVHAAVQDLERLVNPSAKSRGETAFVLICETGINLQPRGALNTNDSHAIKHLQTTTRPYTSDEYVLVVKRVINCGAFVVHVVLFTPLFV